MSIRPGMDVRLEQVRSTGVRRTRRPTHSFRLRTGPWCVTPCLLAPVLAGDTLQSGTYQARVISDPLNDKVAGWFCEFFLAYVKINDLGTANQRDEMRDLVVSGLASDVFSYMSGSHASRFYDGHSSSSKNASLMQYCYQAIINGYFRDEGEIAAGASGYTYGGSSDWSGYNVCQVRGPGWMDSGVVHTDTGVTLATGPEDWDDQWAVYQQMRSAHLTTATYEEWLAQQGIEAPLKLEETDDTLRIPEMIMRQRDFVHPQQIVEPTTGVAAAVVQWNLAGKIMRRRSFGEPGFLVGLMVMRPKVYNKNLRGSAANYLMNRPEAWMPSNMETDPHARLHMFTGDGTVAGGGSGPIYGAEGDYWLDPKDLLERGDQFLNMDLQTTVSGALDGVALASLPDLSDDAYPNWRYPNSTDGEALFLSSSNKRFEIDGMCSLSILSRAGGRDSTGRNVGSVSQP